MKTSLFATFFAVAGLIFLLQGKFEKTAPPVVPAAVVAAPAEKLTRERPLTEAQAKRKTIASVTHVLQDSHQIFSEAWRLLVGAQSSIPNSAMKAVGARLTQHMGQHQDVLAETELCPKKDHDVLQMGAHEILLQHKTCSKLVLEPVATIHWNPEQGQMSLEVNPSQLVEGVGESLAMLNAKISCDFKIADNERILQFSCKNLGQGTQRAQHYAFERFEYHADQHDLLIVDADRFINLLEKTTCVSKEPCFRLKVPLEGKIKIVENRKMGKPTQASVVVEPPAMTSLPLLGLPPGMQNTLPPQARQGFADDRAGFDNFNPQGDTGALQGDLYQDPQRALQNKLAYQQKQQQLAQAGGPQQLSPESPEGQQPPPQQAQGEAAPITQQPSAFVGPSPQAGQQQIEIDPATQLLDENGNPVAQPPIAVAPTPQQAAPQAAANPNPGAAAGLPAGGVPLPEGFNPANQGFPVEGEGGYASPELQPSGNGRDDVQPRQPSGQQDSAVFLPQGQYPGLHN